MRWPLKRRPDDPTQDAAKERERAEAADRQRQDQEARERSQAEAARRQREERVARETRRQQAAAQRRRVAGQLAATALSWGANSWIEGAMWVCLAGGLAVDYLGSYADLAATFGAFGYSGWVRWLMPLGIDLPVTASVLGQLLAGRWRCGRWVRVQLGALTAITAPLTLIGNALRGFIGPDGHWVSSFQVAVWMDLAAFAVPGLGVVLIGWIASMMQGERAELTRRRLEGEAEAAKAAEDDQDVDVGRVPAHSVAEFPVALARAALPNGHAPATRPAMAERTTGHDREGDRPASESRPDDGPSDCHGTGRAPAGVVATAQSSDGGDEDDNETAVMTAEEARTAVVRMVRQAQRRGERVAVADIERATGRHERQARRLREQAEAEIRDNTPARRPRVPSFGQAAVPATAVASGEEG